MHPRNCCVLKYNFSRNLHPDGYCTNVSYTQIYFLFSRHLRNVAVTVAILVQSVCEQQRINLRAFLQVIKVLKYWEPDFTDWLMDWLIFLLLFPRLWICHLHRESPFSLKSRPKVKSMWSVTFYGHTQFLIWNYRAKGILRDNAAVTHRLGGYYCITLSFSVKVLSTTWSQ